MEYISDMIRDGFDYNCSHPVPELVFGYYLKSSLPPNIQCKNRTVWAVILGYLNLQIKC